MEEYMEKLISQIRCAKARPYVADEIKGHIEDQIATNKEIGMTDEEAEENAVRDMGDPIAVGVSMDKIHRPKIAWNVIAIVSLISILAIAVQWSIERACSQSDFAEKAGNANYLLSTSDFVVSILLGIAAMTIIYFIDYTLIAKYAKFLGFAIIVFAIVSVRFGTQINGGRYSVFGYVGVSVATFMMYYVPIYGAILYQYRAGGVAAFLKAILWMIIPIVIARSVPNWIVMGILMVSMLMQLTFALARGWFRVKKRLAIAALWTTFLGLPILGLAVLYFGNLLREYQKARIDAFFVQNDVAGYEITTVREYFRTSALVGKSVNNVLGNLPDLNRDYVYAYIVNSYGLLAGVLVMAAITALIVAVWSSVLKQKNELGLTIGVGCGMLLLVNSLINVLCSIGLFPPAASFLPFFSAGGSNVLLSYTLIGFVMSIYRYKDIYPKNLPADVRRESM